MDSHSFFGGLIISVITALLAENFVFARALGVSTMIMAAKNKRNLPGICLGVLYFTLTASWAAWLLSHRAADIQKPFVPLTYVLTIGLIYLITLLLAFIFFKGRFGRIKKYVHISAFNSVIMGTIFLSMNSCTALYEYLLFGLCSGAGFAAASVIWELDSWSLAKQSGIYFLTISIITLPVAYFANWMKHSLAGVLSYAGIFTAIFVVVWISQYLLWKRNIKRMNAFVSEEAKHRRK